ncbi:Maf family nucleotide pyrophosphatase [Bartonella ancashensis]|uniref:7-methyl-GTP pyrophosphatase n=1 Tax=Bartonella ancashensis TaxID=1318743 RepID=A0A0M4M5E3_9HYPH|nr:Septum formation protein Maf [Bartonella ancashensis]
MKNKLILASLSIYRAQLLKKAGLDFSIKGSSVDEREIEKNVELKTPKELSSFLAYVKAKDVSNFFPDSFIIGCDQVLDLNGKVLHKVKNREKARERLQILSGQTHSLHSAISLVREGKEIWSEVFSAHMTMRTLSSEFIENYLNSTKQDIFNSVGVYQIEGKGIHLFEKIEGDYFTIIGLPLLPLLAKLRHLEIIDS